MHNSQCTMERKDKNNVILIKSKNFALRIIKLHQYLNSTKGEYVISKQLLRCGTSIGANIREGVRAQSKNDFIAKMNISLKEASETEYWLELLYESDYIDKKEFNSIYADCKELLRLLISIIKSAKKKD